MRSPSSISSVSSSVSLATGSTVISSVPEGRTQHKLMYQSLADEACERITKGIVREYLEQRPVCIALDPYNPTGSTRHVNFTTSKKTRWKTDARRSHINWAICDSDWEAEFCRVAEGHSLVRAYVKNQGLGFEAPYQYEGALKSYVPDFIVDVDDGRGDDDPLHVVVEVKRVPQGGCEVEKGHDGELLDSGRE